MDLQDENEAPTYLTASYEPVGNVRVRKRAALCWKPGNLSKLIQQTKYRFGLDIPWL